MVVRTRAQQTRTMDEAFEHILSVILEQPNQDDPLRVAMEAEGVDDFTSLSTLEKEEVEALEYKTDPMAPVSLPVPMRTKRLLKHFILWNVYLQEKRTSTLSAEELKALTSDAFQNFRHEIVPKYAMGQSIQVIVAGQRAGTATVVTSTPSAVTSSVDEWQKGHKRNTAVYHKWNGERIKWFPIKDNWNLHFGVDGVDTLLCVKYVVPVSGTSDFALHSAKSTYIYSILSDKVSGCWTSLF